MILSRDYGMPRDSLLGYMALPIVLMIPLIFFFSYISDMSEKGLVSSGGQLMFFGMMGVTFNLVLFLCLSVARVAKQWEEDMATFGPGPLIPRLKRWRRRAQQRKATRRIYQQSERQWTITLDGATHQVAWQPKRHRGTYILRVDGRSLGALKAAPHPLLAQVVGYAAVFNDHLLAVFVHPENAPLRYELLVDGRSVDTGRSMMDGVPPHYVALGVAVH
ncbi:MAG: hypothetical protein JXA33_09985, partial [Anaerolineae bacterium]|nr:hypothetical protein [Anaerolineae bacterium]